MWTFSPKSRVLKDGYLEEFALIVCKSIPSALRSSNTDSDVHYDTIGFLFGQLSSKIILAQLTRGPFPFSWSLLVPLLIPAIAINTPYLGLYVILKLYGSLDELNSPFSCEITDLRSSLHPSNLSIFT